MHGRYEEAEISYREAWQGYEKQLRSDLIIPTAILKNLATSCRSQENFNEAGISLMDSVEVCQKCLGSDHPDSLRAFMNLSICLDKQQQKSIIEVLNGGQNKLGLHHPYTMRTFERLAHMLWMQAQHDGAEHFAHYSLINADMLSGAERSGSCNTRPFLALETLYPPAWRRCRS